MTPQAAHKTIQVYFLAAPEDQSVCEDIIKHLKPIIRSSPVPIEVNSDFNIPAGMEKEKHQSQLFEADIVLALISVDFIDNDDIYNRNQKVIERHNNHQTVMIPILVRNFMWKATPFVSLPVVPKNLQPLNNRQFWNSPDDAVMAVVSDIYDSIHELAQRQRAILEPFTAETGERTADVQQPSESAVRQPAPDSPMTPAPPKPSEAVQPLPVAGMEPAQVPTAPVETSTGQMEPSMKEAPALPSGGVQPAPAAEVKPAPDLKAAPVGPTPQATATSQSAAHSQIAADWRTKYYRTVALKRAGAILLDHILLYIALIIILLPFADSPDEVFSSAMGWGFLVLYFVIMPLMESSKWQGTIGKRILKLQITDREGERITFLRAFWRNVMRSLVLYSYFFVIPLIFQYFRFQKTRKLFHDELSGTVIGERLTSSAAVRDVTGVAGSAG
jgi:uncharacterized RDD family membrane protein YckC